MDRPTKAVIRVALAVCVICIALGFYYFGWQGVDTSVVNDPNYPSAGGVR